MVGRVNQPGKVIRCVIYANGLAGDEVQHAHQRLLEVALFYVEPDFSHASQLTREGMALVGFIFDDVLHLGADDRLWVYHGKAPIM
ncbi:hypothetical protein SP029_00692 [Salmonella phage FSL SP-029]|uniref:Uncharacterized protein n=1 Tax=Salmonella phage FSL SP-029 TaxID=1173767 RepID=S4TT97_9CAUD|nr:hypothetical protein SP029_00692 [Salmonella phage FSL SP-029]